MKYSHATCEDRGNNVSAHFPASGLVRLKSIIAPGGPLPISKSSWWAGVKDGRYPKSRKISSRVTVWKAEEINELLAAIERGEIWRASSS